MPPRSSESAPKASRKRSAGISIFQSDAPVKSARKKAAELSVFDHGVQRDTPTGSEWIPPESISTALPAGHAASGPMAGLPMRRTRSRGADSAIPTTSLAATTTGASSVVAPIPNANVLHGVPMHRTRPRGTAQDAAHVLGIGPRLGAVAWAQMRFLSGDHNVSTVPAGLPTSSNSVGDWAHSSLGVSGGATVQGISMRRTRSRGLSSEVAHPSNSMLPPGLSLPPARPMIPSLSEDALAIGLDMEEAAAALQDDQPSTGASPSPRLGGHHRTKGATAARGWTHSRPLNPPSSSTIAISQQTDQTTHPVQAQPQNPPTAPMLQGSPMRRTRSQGLSAIPMTHSVSDVISSFFAE